VCLFVVIRIESGDPYKMDLIESCGMNFVVGN